MIVALLATTASMRAGQPTEFDSSQFGVNIRRVDGMSKKPDASIATYGSIDKRGRLLS